MEASKYSFIGTTDESGWVWLIPLHNGTTSVGVVMNQDTATAKKRAAGQSKTPEELYSSSIQLAPSIHKLLDEATLLSEIKHASDYSYSASCYSSPYLRIVGDAGCFIDPYFSSGVHLALTSGLSAATTIVASIRGHDEAAAAQWHSTKFGDAYTRFLLIVLSAYKQIRRQEDPILSDFDEDNFDRAFGVFRAGMCSQLLPLADYEYHGILNLIHDISSNPRVIGHELKALPNGAFQHRRFLFERIRADAARGTISCDEEGERKLDGRSHPPKEWQ